VAAPTGIDTALALWPTRTGDFFPPAASLAFMHERGRTFLEDLLATASPSGFETPSQRVWTDYVRGFADDVTVDAYGNAVAVHEGAPDAPTIALSGHADEIGFIVRDVLDDGFLRIARIGGSDRTVSKGQHVTVHADEPVQGVIGQTAIHLRNPEKEQYDEITGQFVDIGATDADEAREHVEIGDPVTFSTDFEELAGDRIAARGIDNRTGTWAAAEGLRRAADRGVDATVYAVSTVQEEVGLRGAQMVGADLDDVDAFVAVDVTHATDNPDVDAERRGPVELGSGPVIGRGSANHAALVDLARGAAATGQIDVQLQAAGSRTGTDADAFYTARGGVPSLTVSIPNRYMHTPVEVVDLGDLDAVADLLAAVADGAADAAPFAVDV
jgi:endoglucanase